MDLTEKQQYFLDYLKKKIHQHGKAPSLRQAASEFGISHTAVSQLLNQLERKGVIARDGHYSRTVRLCADDHDAEQNSGREIPVIGQIAAGLPLYAQQEWDGTVTVDGRMFRGENLFCLKIKGQSMRNAGILDGDYVICEPRQYAANGEIVVALIHDEEATVKRFKLHKDHITLLPENDAFSPMEYQFNEVMVQGKVIGVIRNKVDL